MFAAFAEFERNRIRERTKECIERAKTGKARSYWYDNNSKRKKAEGLSQRKVAEELGLGIATVKRHWNIIS